MPSLNKAKRLCKTSLWVALLRKWNSNFLPDYFDICCAGEYLWQHVAECGVGSEVTSVKKRDTSLIVTVWVIGAFFELRRRWLWYSGGICSH